MSQDPLEKKRQGRVVIPIRGTSGNRLSAPRGAWRPVPERDDRWLMQSCGRAGVRRIRLWDSSSRLCRSGSSRSRRRIPPKTVVLIHGLWMAPQCWEFFSHHDEARGYRVLAPAWPRMAERVEEIRRDPMVLGGLGLKEITDHYARLIRALPAAPILMGHCTGGLVVQMLLDRGLGSAGVAIDPAIPKGVAGLPLGLLGRVWPALSRSFHTSNTVMLPFNVFRRTYANTLSDGEAIRVYQRNIVPGPCRPLYQSLFASLTSHSDATVNFNNSERAPLLLIAGGEDLLAPPELVRLNYECYQKSSAVTEFQEFSRRSHLIHLQTGWQVVAGYALSWAEENARRGGDAAWACDSIA
ncbi:MAG: alpha/beta hydrolase [Paludibaculum sp.]